MSAIEPVAKSVGLDQFFTPPALADALVHKLVTDNWWRSGIVLEPSCGHGAFVEAALMNLQPQGVVALDVDPACCELVERKTIASVVCQDFLTMKIGENGGPFDLVLGNPPFNQAEKHVRAALDQRASFGIVAFLLRLAFLESKERKAFWKENPASKIYVLSQRPSFSGGGTDNSAYGVFVWASCHRGPTELEGMAWK